MIRYLTVAAYQQLSQSREASFLINENLDLKWFVFVLQQCKTEEAALERSIVP